MNFKEFETEQKLRGGYYTERDIADYLSRWVLEVNPKRILEPSCGDGAFIRSLLTMRTSGLREILGCEINPAEAKAAKRLSPAAKSPELNIHVGDFLAWSLAKLSDGPAFDAVVGNPPFIRYQYLDANLQAKAEQIFARFNLPFTKHTNAWVPFIIASIAQLRPGGRLAMVVPAELLHVIHARGLRDYMLATCSRILVLDPRDIWFTDTLQGIMLLFAEKATAAGVAEIAVKTVKSREELNGHAHKHFQAASYTSGSRMNGKWMLSLLSGEERSLLEAIADNPHIKRFKDVADVDVGIVTGANKFFLVSDAIVDEYELHRWALPMFGRSDHVLGVVYDKANHEANRDRGLPTNFIYFPPVDRRTFSEPARRYIRLGESQGLHKRFKCRVRSPWYSVPSVHRSAVGMLKRAHHLPRLILNRANAFTTDTAYRIKAPSAQAASLVAGFVNSLTALTAELEGRHYGGGVLELVPSEIEKLLIPTVVENARALKSLDSLVKSGAEPESVLEQQDNAVLVPLGISRSDCRLLRLAWQRLRDRRHRNEPSPSENDG